MCGGVLGSSRCLKRLYPPRERLLRVQRLASYRVCILAHHHLAAALLINSLERHRLDAVLQMSQPSPIILGRQEMDCE